MAASARRPHHHLSGRTTSTCRRWICPRAFSSSSSSRPPSIASGHTVEEVVDLVVVGAGIVGLWTAHEALRRGASVALVDARRPCAGGEYAQATGAGQGYLWLSHRGPPDTTPSSPSSLTPSAASWHLAARGKARWERLARPSAGPVAAALARRAELRRTGSLLLATSDEEAAALEARAARLCAAPGGPAEADVRVLATRAQVEADEPALGAGAGGGPAPSPSSPSSSLVVRAALLVGSDAQISGRGAALGLLDACRRQGAGGGGRFLEALEDGVGSITASATTTMGGGARVATASGRRFRARRAVVVAGGAWTGGLLADALERADGAAAAASWRAFFAPRRGHLLEVEPGAARLPAPLRRGVMELSYARHYKDAGREGAGGGEESGGSGGGGGGGGGEVTFTATAGGAGGAGPVLLGSSREDAGFDGRADGAVVAAILGRAAEFLPTLRPLAESARARDGGGLLLARGAVRVGLRPVAAGGLPAVGPVPGLPGVVVAAGHEGSGLVMAPATAELALRWAGIFGGQGEEEEEEEGGAWAQEEAVASCLSPERRLLAAAALLA